MERDTIEGGDEEEGSLESPSGGEEEECDEEEEEGAVGEDEDEDIAEPTKLCTRRSSRIAKAHQ